MNGRFAVALAALVIVACAEPPSTPTAATRLEGEHQAPVFAKGGDAIMGQYTSCSTTTSLIRTAKRRRKHSKRKAN